MRRTVVGLALVFLMFGGWLGMAGGPSSKAIISNSAQLAPTEIGKPPKEIQVPVLETDVIARERGNADHGSEFHGGLSNPTERYTQIDPAFAKYVEMGLLSEALSALDASLLADVALGLAQGERVLVRMHRSGLTADHLMSRTVKLAVHTKNKATQDRIEKAATTLNRPLWAKLAMEAKEFGEVSRDGPMVAVGKIDVQTFALIESVRRSCSIAGLTDQKAELEVLKKDVAASHADTKVKAHLTEMIDSCIKNLPEKGDETGKVLAEFSAASRQFSIKIPRPIAHTPFDPTTWRLPPQDTTQFVGYTKVKLVTRIFLDSRIKSPIHYYIDGTLQKPLSPGFHATHTRTYNVGGNSGPARMNIRFHNGKYYSDGRHIYDSYALDGGNYEFTYVGNELELFRH